MSDKKGKKTEKTERSGCNMTTPGGSGTQQQQQTMDPAAVAIMAAVSVKLPSFWTDNPRAWFIQADSQFAISNITVQLVLLNSTTSCPRYPRR